MDQTVQDNYKTLFSPTKYAKMVDFHMFALESLNHEGSTLPYVAEGPPADPLTSRPRSSKNTLQREYGPPENNTPETPPSRKRKYENPDLQLPEDADGETVHKRNVADSALNGYTGYDSIYAPKSPSEKTSSQDHYSDGLPSKALKRSPGSTPHDDSERVASHYNRRRQLNLNERSESRIIYMRNFNNWIKSVIIGKHAVRDGAVLDLGCGKGGDLLKWGKGRIRRLVGLDIAEKSIHDARKRWEDMRAPKFEAEFHTLDCFSYPLSTRIPRNEMFDVVSMQFALHYSFESEEKVLRILQNITSNLKLGGSFIGTIPDANWIVKKLRSLPGEELKFGNSRYYIKFEQKDEYPLYGHRYIFNLEDAIQECPEYLVHFPTFVSLAERYGLELIYKMRFHDLYAESKDEPRFRDLLYKMRVISDEGEMSEDEWEAVGIYMAFAFRKVR